MPRLVDFPIVVEQMNRQGMVSLYPNSGAFGFPPGVASRSVGWVGPDDPSIRPEARPLVRRVPEPHAATLARLAVRAWADHLPGGPIWVLPKSHWAYELMFGSTAWMPALLTSVGASAVELEGRHDGTALEFAAGEADRAATMIEGLLGQLFGSDYMLAWPGRPVVCTVHHHRQLWWTTTDAALHAVLEAIVG